MVRDFTFETYKKLCSSILENKIIPSRVDDYIKSQNGKERRIVLRHDVDKKPNHALIMAEIEHSFGIKSTYYFRTTEEVYNRRINISGSTCVEEDILAFNVHVDKVSIGDIIVFELVGGYSHTGSLINFNSLPEPVEIFHE